MRFAFCAAAFLSFCASGAWNAQYGYDGAGRLVSEQRSGQGGYHHSYEYDANDNRTQQTTHLNSAVDPVVRDFNTLAPEVSALSGAWYIAGGKQHGDKPADQDEARTRVTLPINALPLLGVKVKPDTQSIANAGETILAGISCFEQTDGSRYLAGVQITRLGGNTFERKLRVLRLQAGQAPEVVAESAAAAYFGEELTLTLIYNSTSFDISLEEDTAQGLSIDAFSAVGPLGLEVRGPAALAVSATFDDLTYYTFTGGSETRNYSYNALNQLLRVSGAETTNFTYDSVGRMRQQTKNGVSTAYDYDRHDRLTSVVTGANTSTYNYAGPSWVRASATVNGAVTNYTYDGHACVAQFGGTNTAYFVPGSTPLWEVTGAQRSVYATDPLNNVTALVDSAISQRYNYTGFGEVKATDANGQPIANSSGPRYRGELYDSATDQHYLRNRYLNPSTARFGSLDPSGSPDGPNRYTYPTDPVNSSDPMGTKIVFTKPKANPNPRPAPFPQASNDLAGSTLTEREEWRRKQAAYRAASIYTLADLDVSGWDAEMVMLVVAMDADPDVTFPFETPDDLIRALSSETYRANAMNTLRASYDKRLSAHYRATGGTLSNRRGPSEFERFAMSAGGASPLAASLNQDMFAAGAAMFVPGVGELYVFAAGAYGVDQALKGNTTEALVTAGGLGLNLAIARFLKGAPAAQNSGRRGNQKTRDHLDQVRDEFLDANPDHRHIGGGKDRVSGQPIPEEYIPGLGGARKGSAYSDLTFEGPTGIRIRINTVDTNAAGDLTSRETRNFDKIFDLTREPIIAPAGALEDGRNDRCDCH